MAELFLKCLEFFQPVPADTAAGRFERILVLRNNHIGDAALVTPVLRDLRKYFPRSFIAAAAGRWACDVFTGNPAIDQVIEINTPWGNKKVEGAGSIFKIILYFLTSQEIKRISASNFDLAVEFSGHPLNRLFLWLCGVPYRMAMTTGPSKLPLAWKTFYHAGRESMGKSFLKSIEALGFNPGNVRPELFINEEDRRSAIDKMSAAGFSGEKKFVVIAPGAGWPVHKAWLPERFSEVAGKIFRQAGTCSVIVGPAEEADLTSQVAKAAGPGVFDLGGKLNLKEYFALISMSSAVVCNNSSALHVAQSFGKPSIVICSGLYGGWKAQEESWGYPEGSYFTGGTKSDCDQTCGRSCPDRECMRQVHADEVFALVTGVLNRA